MKRADANRAKSCKPIEQKRRARAKASVHEIQLPLDRDELLSLMQDSLETLATELGLLVAFSLMEDEVTRLCGQRYEHSPIAFTRGKSHPGCIKDGDLSSPRKCP